MAEIVKSSHKNAARSRYLIKQAFAQLMNEKDIHKITVTDIVERANISRGTFYAHYVDVYDLCIALQNNAMVAIDETVESIGVLNILSNPTDAIYIGVKFLEKNKAYYGLYLKSPFGDGLISRIMNKLEIRFTDAVSELFTPEQQIEFSKFIVFMLGACKNVIVHWFDNESNISAEEWAGYLSEKYLQAEPEFFADYFKSQNI